MSDAFIYLIAFAMRHETSMEGRREFLRTHGFSDSEHAIILLRIRRLILLGVL